MLRAILVVVACLVGVLLYPHQPAPAEAPVAAANIADSVQVARRLVTVELAAAEPSGRSTRPTPVVAAVAKKAGLMKRTDTRPAPFVERAARFVLGDGRVRPEPFPRPSR